MDKQNFSKQELIVALKLSTEVLCFGSEKQQDELIKALNSSSDFQRFVRCAVIADA